MLAESTPNVLDLATFCHEGLHFQNSTRISLVVPVAASFSRQSKKSEIDSPSFRVDSHFSTPAIVESTQFDYESFFQCFSDVTTKWRTFKNSALNSERSVVLDTASVRALISVPVS